jgi:hypothetical protein
MTAENILMNAAGCVSNFAQGKRLSNCFLTGNGEPRHLSQRSRKVNDPEEDQSNDAPDHVTSGVIGNCTKADGPGEDMAGHAENEKYGLSGSTKLSSNFGYAKGLEQYLESVCHIVNLHFLR